MAGTDTVAAVLDQLRELRDRYNALADAAEDYDTSARWAWRTLGVLDAIDLVREGLDQ